MNWNMDDYAEIALGLVKRDADGTITRFGCNFPSWSMERIYYHLERFGGAFVHHDRPKECLLDMPESQEALEWMRARYWDDHSFAEPLLTDRSWGSNIFTNEYTAMYEGNRPSPWNKRDTNGIFDYDVEHCPTGPKDFYGLSAEGRTSYMVTDGFGMWSGTKWPDAAWEVDKFLAEPTFQEIRMRASGGMAVRMSAMVYYEEAMVNLEPSCADMSLYKVMEAFEMGYGRDDERYFCQSEAEEIINPLLEKIFIVGGTPVSVLADACPEINASQTCEVA
jgi:hypothetical protein